VTAAGYAKAPFPANIEAGKNSRDRSRIAALKASPADWKDVWERPDDWNVEGDWLVRRGGNFCSRTFPQTAGAYSFTVWRKGKSAQWLVNYLDQRTIAC